MVSPLWPTKNLFPNVSELVSYVIISPNFALCFWTREIQNAFTQSELHFVKKFADL